MNNFFLYLGKVNLIRKESRTGDDDDGVRVKMVYNHLQLPTYLPRLAAFIVGIDWLGMEILRIKNQVLVLHSRKAKAI